MPNTTPILTKRYYPRLSDIITLDDLPDFLNFAKEGLEGLLGSIYYKNLKYSKSYRGDSAFYSIDIITKNLGLDLPFGLRLVLNPDLDGDTSISSFPVSLQYQWEMLAFLRSFNLANFSYTPEAFFNLGLQIFKVTDEEVIAHILNNFVESGAGDVSGYEQLVEDINAAYPDADLSLPAGQTPTVDLLAQLITQNEHIPDNVAAVMFFVYLLDDDDDSIKARVQRFYDMIVPGGIEDYIQKLIKPWIRATLTLSAGIEFPTNILKPVDVNGNVIPNTKSLFQFAEATFIVDSEAGIGAQLELGGSLIPTYAQIGNTGFTISFTNAKLDLSTTSNIPEADAAGYPVDFVGLYVQQASIAFSRFGDDDTTKVSAAIIAENLLIGTGGISGILRLENNGLLYRKFGNFAVELDAFSVTFRQNAILGSAISGKLMLSRFLNEQGQPATVLIDAMIRDNGDFSVSARPQNFIPKITWPNVFELVLRSFKLGELDDHFYIEVSGTLSFIADLPVLGDFLPKNLEITKLVIWDDGRLEFVGGVLQVPKSFTLKVGPVKLEVDHLTISPYRRQHEGADRSYLCIGFDGMINTGRAGVQAGGNGMKYYFSIDDGPFDQFFSVEGIVIDMTIPGNVPKSEAMFILHGLLNVQQPSSENSLLTTEYTGAISFEMPKLRLGGSAGMRLAPDVPAFVVDIGIELPTPIPVFAGLGIYAFRGLIGQHYVPSKQEAGLGNDATWWDYYKAPGKISGRKGVQVDKMANESGFSIGAGASIATSFDGGFTFSAKLFVMLGLPKVFLLQGQAGILSSRLGLNDDRDPPFSALVAIGDQSFQANLGVNFRIPDSGFIFSLRGELDVAFYLNNASGWHLYLGKDQPESARIQARILSIVQGYAYLMISARGIRAGAGASIGFNLNAGIVAVGFNAYLNLGGHISFKPFQIGGYIEMGGSAYVRILFVKFGLGLRVGLAVEAPNPVNIIGYLEVSVKIIFKRIRARLEIRLGPSNNDLGPLKVPIAVLEVPDPAKGYLPAAATHMLTGESFTINYVTHDGAIVPPPGDPAWKYNFNDPDSAENVTVPLDSFIDIELLKPVKPGELLGGAGNQVPEGYREVFPPDKGVNHQVVHEYTVSGLDILVWQSNASGGQWVPYNIYEAVTAIAQTNSGPDGIQLNTLKPGYWQFTDKNKYNKVRLLSQDMFSYLGKTERDLPDIDALNFSPGDLFCFDRILKRRVINWQYATEGDTYPANNEVLHDGASFHISGNTQGWVIVSNGEAGKELRVEGPEGSLQIVLPEAASTLEVELGARDHALIVEFYSTVYLPFFYNITRPFPVLRGQQYLPAGPTGSVAEYNDLNAPVDRMVLKFDGRRPGDYTGDLQIGGHIALPEGYWDTWLTPPHLYVGIERSLIGLQLFDRGLSQADLLGSGASDALFAWSLDGSDEAPGWISGSPDLSDEFTVQKAGEQISGRSAYVFSGTADALIVPYQPELKVEEGSFGFVTTVVFSPFTTGTCTLWSKLSTDSATGLRRGYSLHLSQLAPENPDAVYPDPEQVPVYRLWLVCYAGASTSGFWVSDPYTTHCGTGKIAEQQFKQVALSVDRGSGTLHIYLDRLLKLSTAIPAELDVFEPMTSYSSLEQISYLTPGLQARAEENGTSETKVIEEVQILNDALNKTVQPIWRPDSIFAVKIQTQDTVSHPGYQQSHSRTQVFGFKTAGPLGHFQQHNKKYQQLLAQDRAGEFKLADLKAYIDYNRSSPDALGRYDLSKPVFWQAPRIKLYFTEAYMNAMFSDWDDYQGLTPVHTQLEAMLIDPANEVILQQLVWNVSTTPVTLGNFRSLPPSQQLVFLFNLAAAGNSCNQMPDPLVKTLRQAAYQFPDLIPGKFYTAVFHSVYQPGGGTAQRAEVHRFSFQTSLYSSFQEQAGSVVLENAPGAEVYAVHPLAVSFTDDQISDRLLKLVNSDANDDPEDTLHYAVPYERIVYGGLGLLHLEPFSRTTICPVVNQDPEQPEVQRLLGIIVSSTEPLNDPKFSAVQLAGTVGLTLTGPDDTLSGPGSFVYLHSRNTASVFITNTGMDIPAESAVFLLAHKIFNGEGYDMDVFETGAIDLGAFLP